MSFVVEESDPGAHSIYLGQFPINGTTKVKHFKMFSTEFFVESLIYAFLYWFDSSFIHSFLSYFQSVEASSDIIQGRK